MHLLVHRPLPGKVSLSPPLLCLPAGAALILKIQNHTVHLRPSYSGTWNLEPNKFTVWIKVQSAKYDTYEEFIMKSSSPLPTLPCCPPPWRLLIFSCAASGIYFYMSKQWYSLSISAFAAIPYRSIGVRRCIFTSFCGRWGWRSDAWPPPLLPPIL